MIRRGLSLLSGLVICGRCGLRMITRYQNNSQDLRYMCCRMAADCGEPLCQSLVGTPLDGLVSELVLKALEPAALEISLKVAEDVEAERHQLDPTCGTAGAVELLSAVIDSCGHAPSTRLQRSGDRSDPQCQGLATGQAPHHLHGGDGERPARPTRCALNPAITRYRHYSSGPRVDLAHALPTNSRSATRSTRSEVEVETTRARETRCLYR